jgi:hypothetical protein
MTKLEASVDKDVALVAKSKNFPSQTAWFVFQGQISNNLGQPVILDFLVVGLKWDGSMFRNIFPFEGFVNEFNLLNPLYTEIILPENIANLTGILPDAVRWGKHYMLEQQQRLEGNMERKLHEYQEQLNRWKVESMQQLELDFNDRTNSNFWIRLKDSKQREIETILSTSSQYYKNLTSLQGDAYLKVLAVFFNAK